jgi:hypothetical protein
MERLPTGSKHPAGGEGRDGVEPILRRAQRPDAQEPNAASEESARAAATRQQQQGNHKKEFVKIR